MPLKWDQMAQSLGSVEFEGSCNDHGRTSCVSTDPMSNHTTISLEQTFETCTGCSVLRMSKTLMGQQQ